MDKKMTAICKSGRRIDYIQTDNPPAGGMKKTFFSVDKSCVVQFYHDQSTGKDPNRIARLEAIIGRYNPTKPESEGGASGGSNETAEYYKKLYCWPTDIVTRPEIGIVCPTYPSNFIFKSGYFNGREKDGDCFVRPKARSLLTDQERGNWLSYLKSCILVARAVKRLHVAGLAHSDLSAKNVLIDPSAKREQPAIIIDIDSLVVPNLYPPDVLGTAGYIAPEVLKTMHLDLQDPQRKHPSIRTDLHALPVMIYQYLLLRHPLRGPKTYPASSGDEQEKLEMGSKALFIEHPKDTSNRPKDLKLPMDCLGKDLSDLFFRAFIEGLHAPERRPAAIEWERALVKTWDLLHPCPNSSCTHKWFVLNQSKPVCPFCGTKIKNQVLMLNFKKEFRPGQWSQNHQLVVYDDIRLFKWHVFDNIYPGETALDRAPVAYIRFHKGQWILVNQALPFLISAGGNRVPVGQATALSHGKEIRLTNEPHGQIMQVQAL